MFKAELSDLFNVPVQREDDPHELNVFILQFATGKTNHGIKLFGRVARHVDVTQCPVGAVAMHLHCGFLCASKFEEVEENTDFTFCETWFDKKFVTEC